MQRKERGSLALVISRAGQRTWPQRRLGVQSLSWEEPGKLPPLLVNQKLPLCKVRSKKSREVYRVQSVLRALQSVIQYQKLQ